MGARTRPGILTPGYVDLQVNGGGGVLLNAEPTVAGMEAIAAAHRRLGTVAILPTLITDAPEVLDRAADAALAAQGRPGHPRPPHRGPAHLRARRGTHAARFIRPLDDRTMDVVRRLREAASPSSSRSPPRRPPRPDRGARRDGRGRLPRPLRRHRGPGPRRPGRGRPDLHPPLQRHVAAHPPRARRRGRGAQLQGPRGDHLRRRPRGSTRCVALALRARPGPDLTYVVSDAMPTVGGPDRFRLYDMDLRVEDGRLVNPEGNLAGAHVTMAESVARLVARVGVAPETALRMAVTVPARLIGRPDLATIEGREAADLLLLDGGLALVGSLADA